MLTSKQKLEYALQLKRLHEIMVVKENLYFAQSNANHNRAVKNLETLQDRIIENRVKNHIDGNVDLINHKPIVNQVMNTALVNQRKGLSKTSNKKIDKLVDKNIKSYQEIMNNRLKLDAHTLEAKIEKEAKKRKYKNLSDNQLKHQLKEEFKGTTKKRINRIVGDALHTNQCNISFATAQEQGYKYKVWNNGRGKSRVRPWHRAKVISAVELDDKFYIYGSYPAYMMYPGDLEGGAENVANCRCWLSYTNITPNNLKTKGTIKIKDNVQLTKPNTVSTNKNTASNNKSLKTKVKESISTKVKTVIQKVKNKFKKLSKKLTPTKLKITSKNNSKKYSNNKFSDNPDRNTDLPDGKPNIKFTQNDIKKELKGFVDSNIEEDFLSKEIMSFLNGIDNRNIEYLSAGNTKFKRVCDLVEGDKKGVKLCPKGIKDNLLYVIHNHPSNKPFPSYKDNFNFEKYTPKYNIIFTENNGIVIFKMDSSNIDAIAGWGDTYNHMQNEFRIVNSTEFNNLKMLLSMNILSKKEYKSSLKNAEENYMLDNLKHTFNVANEIMSKKGIIVKRLI